jgi:3-hydroxy-9,10-secoandrosta-1,3,5(10)-triene-9,17-dione monooxygenase reductase component
VKPSTVNPEKAGMGSHLDHGATVSPAFDGRRFRTVLGHFCTGVAVIATMDGTPVGFACQSFGALSLDPPLVSFSVMNSSRSWPRIVRAGAFCASILSAGQEAMGRTFGTRGADKFAGVAWSPAPVSGSPRLEGALAWVDCTVDAVLPGGDHRIVIGRVRALGSGDGGTPLLCYRGVLGATAE